MKKAINLFTLFIIFYSTVVKAQITQEWVSTYNGLGDGFNVPKKCVIDKLGNIIVTGRSDNGSGYDDFITLKYNSSGNLLWQRRYNGVGNGDDGIAASALDDSDNIYVTGYSQEGASLGGYNWITIKYYPNGDTAWKRSFNWTNNSTDEPFAMAIDKFNNIYISGYGRTGQPFDDDFITIKYNSNGIQQWINVYASILLNTDHSNSIAVDDSCNVYSSGYGSILEGDEVITIKYSSKGDETWIRRFPTNYADFLRHTVSTIDKFNNIIVNAYYYYEGAQYAFNTIKYNSSGDMLWNRIYKGDGNLNFCFALCTDDSANVYAAGRSTSTGTGNDFVTIKYNQYGDTSWIKVYDGGDYLSDEIHAIAVDSLENVYVTGVCQAARITGLDYLTIKYDQNGNMIWNTKYNGMTNEDDISYSISLDKNGNVIVSGAGGINTFYCGITTIKYSALTGIQNRNINTKDLKFSLSQNYPNPFNPVTKLGFVIPDLGFISLKVYDALGKEVKTLVNENKPAGNYEVKFDGSDLSSGIYFYSLSVDGNVMDTKRMVLLK